MHTSAMCYTFQKEKKTPIFGVEEKGEARKKDSLGPPA